MSRLGKLGFNNTSFSIWEERQDEKDFMTVYGVVIKHLRSRGFKVVQDPETKRRSPTLAKTHHYAQKGDLEASLNLRGCSISIEFYQNVANVNNSNGGRYCFDKFERMPYLIQKQFILETGKLVDVVGATYGYGFGEGLAHGDSGVSRVLAGLRGINPSLQPLERFNSMWGADRFKRDDSGWPAVSEFDNNNWNKDADGVPLRNGMIRYNRDSKGYLRRGVIYTNMNSMWQLIYGKNSTWVSCGQLFSLPAGGDFRKVVPLKTKVQRLNAVLAELLAAQNFERAIKVRDVLKGLDV